MASRQARSLLRRRCPAPLHQPHVVERVLEVTAISGTERDEHGSTGSPSTAANVAGSMSSSTCPTACCDRHRTASRPSGPASTRGRWWDRRRRRRRRRNAPCRRRQWCAADRTRACTRARHRSAGGRGRTNGARGSVPRTKRAPASRFDSATIWSASSVRSPGAPRRAGCAHHACEPPTALVPRVRHRRRCRRNRPTGRDSCRTGRRRAADRRAHRAARRQQRGLA